MSEHVTISPTEAPDRLAVLVQVRRVNRGRLPSA